MSDSQGFSACERPGHLTARCRDRCAMRRWSTPTRLGLCGLLLLAAGCSGDSAEVVRVSPRDAAGQAVTEFDANKDGSLDAKELASCPGLLGALKKVDKNNDGQLSTDEIADRLAFFQQQGMQMDVVAEVTLDGKPLAGATVTLTPEKFMGPLTKAASTVTDEEGTGVFRPDGAEEQPVAPGYYRVRVTKNVQGRELIPTRYNTQTTLGQEIVPEAEGRGSSLTVKLRLKSR